MSKLIVMAAILSFVLLTSAFIAQPEHLQAHAKAQPNMAQPAADPTTIDVYPGYYQVNLGSPVYNSTPIQAAVDYVPSGQGFDYIINVHAGTYYETVTVDSTKDGLTVQGEGAILNGTGLGSNSGFTVVADNVTIQNFIIMNYVEDGIFVQGNDSSGIWVPAEYNTVRNNTIEYCQGAMYLNVASFNLIEKNTVEYSALSEYIHGLLVDVGSNNVIQENTFFDNGGTGIALSSAGSTQVVSNNVTSNGWVSGFGLFADGACADLTIKGNIFDQNGYGSPTQWGGLTGGGMLISSSSNTISDNEVNGNNGTGIVIVQGSYSLIQQNEVDGNGEYGIEVGFPVVPASYNNISGNNVANNAYGIGIDSSSNNEVTGNDIVNNSYGLYLNGSSSYNSLIGNRVMDNDKGIGVDNSSSNNIYHNNFINSAVQVSSLLSTNSWDNGYPSGGNYWSDYNGTDFFSGPYQNVTGSDGIGDTPYVIDVNNTDHYPLMIPWTVPSATIDWWPMYRHDLSHLGYSTSAAQLTNQTLWIYNAMIFGGSSPIVADGMVYVGGWDWNVYALNARTGAYIWNYTTGNVPSTAAVSDGIVYVGSDKFYALNATTGAYIWSYPMGVGTNSAPAVVDGVVYVGGTAEGKVYALNATTGAYIWSYQTGGYVFSSPAVVGGVVYIGSYDHNVYALNATTGAYIWNYTTSFVDSSPAVVGGVVYFGSYDHNVYALNATTGAYIWNYTTGDYVSSDPAVAYGIVYIGSADHNVYALNATTGAHIWNYTGGNRMNSPIVADGIVYVGSEDHNVYALDAFTGALVWSYTTGFWVNSPAIADGVVYVSSYTNYVYAIGQLGHDVAVTDVTSSTDGCLPMPTVGQGYGLNITVTAADVGSYTETFNVTVYANTTYVASQNVTLSSGNSTNLMFIWNTTGFAYGNYTLSAYASPVPGETNTANNNFTGATVEVTIPGDVNGDGHVNILDDILVSNAFLSTPGSRYWNPNADINGDGQVNILDDIVLSNHWTG